MGVRVVVYLKNDKAICGLAFSLERGPKYIGDHKFLEIKIEGHKFWMTTNVGSHKMTINSVFIFSKRQILIKI